MRFFLTELKPEMAGEIVDLFYNFPETEFGISYPETQIAKTNLQDYIKNQQNSKEYIKKFVFYYENVPVGFASFDSKNFSKTHNCNIVDVSFCIRESYRNFGLGNLVLNKLISKAFELKMPLLVCFVQSENEKAKKVLHINNFKKQENLDEFFCDDKNLFKNKKTGFEMYFLKLKL